MKKQDGKQRLFEVMLRLDKTFKSKLNENFEEFTPHGTYTVSNTGGYEIMLNDAGDAAKVRDAFGSDNPKTSDWLEIEYIPDEETGESEPVIDPNGYNIPLNQVMRINEDAPPFNSLDPNLERDTPEYDDAVSKHYAQFGIKASMVVLSHLSDAQIEISVNPKLAKVRMNFVKYLINKLGGNLNSEINPEEMFEDFKKEYNIDMSKIN